MMGRLHLAALGVSLAASAAGAQSRPDLAAPYARYKTPGECAQADPRRERQFWYDQRPDTAYHAPMHDVAQRSTVEAVRACLARFSLASVAQRDLIGLGQAQLAAEWPAQADSTFQRLLGLLSKGALSDRAWAMSQIVGLYADAPGGMPRALAYVKQLDAMGAEAAPGRLIGYMAIARRAQIADSLALIDSAVTGALAASRALQGDSAKQYAPLSAAAYLALADLQGRRHEPEKAIATVQLARTTLIPLRPSLQRSLAGAEFVYTFYGKPSPTVKASSWFGGEGSTTQRPKAGKISLLVFGYHSCGGQCYSGYAVLRRLVAKYASAGLDVTWMSRTQGFYQNGLVKPDSEAALINNYFTKIVGLPPMTLAVWTTGFQKSQKDGRMMVTSAPNEEAFHPRLNPPLPVFLVDRNGVVQCVSWLNANFEALLDHQIAQMR